MNVRRTTLLVAIVLAVGTGWLTLTYLSALRPPSNEQRPVLIATQEIEARSRIVAAGNDELASRIAAAVRS